MDTPMIAEIETHGRRIADIVDDLNAALESLGIEFGEYGFGDMSDDEPIAEDFRWFACFPHQGSNEGHYVNLCLLQRGRYRLVSCAKTYGWDSACEIASAASRMLSHN